MLTLLARTLIGELIIFATLLGYAVALLAAPQMLVRAALFFGPSSSCR